MPGLRAAGNFGQLAEGLGCFCDELVSCYSDLLQDRNDDAVFVFKQGGEQVQRQQLRVAVLGRERARALNRFLRFDSEFIPTDCHSVVSAFNLLDGKKAEESHFSFLPRSVRHSGHALTYTSDSAHIAKFSSRCSQNDGPGGSTIVLAPFLIKDGHPTLCPYPVLPALRRLAWIRTSALRSACCRLPRP